MKKSISMLLVIGLVLIVLFASPLQILAAEEGNTVLVMRGRENIEDHEIEIEVTVKENSGVCGMLLSLTYDTSVFTLIGLEYGTAFSSLSPIHTNTETAEGYGIYPFKITYLGEENDTSTGMMMTLRFRVKDDAPDGIHTITLSHERDRDVTYLKDREILTKNLLIDGAKITLAGNKITSIGTITDSSKPYSITNPPDGIWLPIAIGVWAWVGGSSVLISVLIARKKPKKWKKI